MQAAGSTKTKNRQKYIYVPVRDESREEDIKQLIKSMALAGGSSIIDDWQQTDAADMLRQIVNNPCFPKAFTAYVENNYVDRIYRDIYYHHYASRHFEQPRNCVRMFFFDGNWDDLDALFADHTDRFIGVCIIQPNGIMGRSYWHPQYFLGKGYYVRTAKFQVNFLGRQLEVPAFPYTMQDREATTCAEVTTLNLIEYYSKSYAEYRTALPSDIEAVEARHSAERIFPSQGMSYADVARSLAQSGLSPRIYASRAPQISRVSMRRYLYYYIESGIPFGVAVESMEPGVLHSIVCVGHGPREEARWLADSAVNYLSKDVTTEGVEFRSCWIANSADAYQTFVVMDDNESPYKTVCLEAAQAEWTGPQIKDGGIHLSVEQLCVPLYKRVFLEIDGAAEMFASFLTSRVGYRAVMKRRNQSSWLETGGERDNPLIVRIFLASSRTFLCQRIQMLDKMAPDEMDERCLEVYQNLYCPRFVWVCEIYNKDTFQEDTACPIGEVVMDATTHRTGTMNSLNGIVLVHYPHYITHCDPDSGWADLINNEIQLDNWKPFGQFRGNLKDFSS